MQEYFSLAFALVQPTLGKSLPKVLEAGEEHPLVAPRKSSFPVHLAGSLEQIHLGFLCQPCQAPPLRGCPSHCSTYLTIINSPEAPTACFVLGSMQLPREQGTAWQLFLYW